MEKLSIENKGQKKKIDWKPLLIGGSLAGITGAGLLGWYSSTQNRTPDIRVVPGIGDPAPQPEQSQAPQIDKEVEDLNGWVSGVDFLQSPKTFEVDGKSIAPQSGRVFESQREAFESARTAFEGLSQYGIVVPEKLTVIPIKPFSNADGTTTYLGFVPNETRKADNPVVNIATETIEGKPTNNEDLIYTLVHESMHTIFPYSFDLNTLQSIQLSGGGTVPEGSYILFNQGGTNYYNNLFEEMAADILTADLLDEDGSLEWDELNTQSRYVSGLIELRDEIQDQYGIEIDPDDFAEIFAKSMMVEGGEVFEEFGNLMEETYGIDDEGVESFTIDFIKSQSDMNISYD